MMTHGIANPHIEYKDSLSDQNTDTGKYTKILAFTLFFVSSLVVPFQSGDFCNIYSCGFSPLASDFR